MADVSDELKEEIIDDPKDTSSIQIRLRMKRDNWIKLKQIADNKNSNVSLLIRTAYHEKYFNNEYNLNNLMNDLKLALKTSFNQNQEILQRIFMLIRLLIKIFKDIDESLTQEKIDEIFEESKKRYPKED